jgi:hypothetical protein
MKTFYVRFMYQGMHSYKGLLTITAENEHYARKQISEMIENDDPRLPDNWDDIKFLEEGVAGDSY